MTETISYIRNRLTPLYSPEETNCFIRMILEHMTGLSPHQLLLCKDKELSATEKEEIQQIVERLEKSEPIQYILGYGWFYDRKFRVNSSVLIPRPETEELVERIIREHTGKKVKLLDIGTGSGCIAISLALGLTGSDAYAMDISPEALTMARRNATDQEATVCFLQHDILQPALPEALIPGTLDIVVSNPPYVLEKEKESMEKNVLEHEPSLALFVPDDDPLLFYRAIAHHGKKLLRTGGKLYFEINAQQGNPLKEMLEEMKYGEVELIRDLSGKDRIIKAVK